MLVSQSSVGVYHDSGTCTYHFDNLSRHNYTFDPASYYIEPENLDRFIVSAHTIKFASYHVPFPPNTEWLDRFRQTYSVADYSVVFCSELHQITVEQLISLDLPNVTIFICGFINHIFKHAHVHTWMDWFITTVHFYHRVQPNLLNEKLLPQCGKSKYFDILLGCKRPHRDFIYQYVHDNRLADKITMTYYQRWNVDLRETDHIFESEGLEFLPESNYTHSVHQVRYYGQRMNLSQVVPFVIYNDSYYSVVAETNAVNEFNFYTEKIVKPILGQRLFVVIAGQGYLERLRSFGFQTFDSVIDESYDQEPDASIRWARAMDQVRYLTAQDPKEIYAKIKGVVEHNQRLMLETDWYCNFTEKLSQVIARKVDGLQDS